MSDDSELEQLLSNFQKALDSLDKIGDVESLITKVDAKKNRKLLKKVKNAVSDVHNKVSTIKEKISNAYKKTKIQNHSDTDDSSFNKSIRDKKTLDNSSHVDHGNSSSPIVGTKPRHSKKPLAQSRDEEKQTDQKAISDHEVSVEGNEQQSDRRQCNGHLEKQGKQSSAITGKQEKSRRIMLDRMDIHDDDELETNDETNVNTNSSIEVDEVSDAVADKNEVDNENMNKNVKACATHEKNDAKSESSQEIIETTPSKTSKLRITLSLRKKQDETDNDVSEVEIMDSATETDDKDEADQEESESNKSIDGQSESLPKNNGNMATDNSAEQSEKKDESQQNVVKKGLEKHGEKKIEDKKNKAKENNSSEDRNKGSDEVERSKKNNEVHENASCGEGNDDSDVVEVVSGDESILTDTNEGNQQITDEKNDNEGSEHTEVRKQTKTINPKKNKRFEVEREHSDEDNVVQSEGKKDRGSEESDDSNTNLKKSKQKHTREINKNTKSGSSEEENSDSDGKAHNGTKKNKSKKKSKSYEDKDENKVEKNMNTCEAVNEDTDRPSPDKKGQKEQSVAAETEKNKSKESKNSEDKDSSNKDKANQKSTDKESDGPKDDSKQSENADVKQDIKEEDSSEKPLVPRIKLVDINKLLAPNKKPMDVTQTPTENKNSLPFDDPIIVLTSSDDERRERCPVVKRPVRKTRTISKVVDLGDSDSNDENIKITKNSQRAKKKDNQLYSHQSSDDSNVGGPTRTRRLRDRKKPVSAFAELIKKRHGRFSSGKHIYTDDSSDEEPSKSVRKSKRIKRRGSTSDSDEDWGEKKLTKNHTKRKRNTHLEQISLCDDSDDSSHIEVQESFVRTSGTNKAEINHTKPDKNDPKFSMKVSIRLPKFKCEQLAEIYKKKKEIFEVKELSNIGLSRSGLPKTSDDSDRPKCKKLKLSLKLNRIEQAKEINSEDEQFSTETAENMKNKADGATNKDIVILDENLETAAPNVEEMEQAEEHSDKEEEKNNGDEHAKKDGNNTSEGKKDKVINSSEEDPKSKVQNNDGKDKEDDGNSKGEEEKLAAKRKVVTNEINDIDDDKIKQTSKKQKNKRKAEKDDSSDEQQEKLTTQNEKDKKTIVSSASDDDNEEQKNRDKNHDHSSEEEDKLQKEKDKKAAGSTSSDSDDDFTSFSRKKSKSKKELVSEAKRRPKMKLISDSDSDGDKSENNDSDGNRSKDKDEAQSDSSEKESEKCEEESEKSKNPTRKRIKRVKDSSSDDEDKSTRKQIRRVIDRDSLSETTKKAEQEEKERKARIAEKQKKYNQIFELKADATVDKVVLDFDEKTDKPLLSVHKKLVKHLKPHQVHGVKFMWDTCFESLERARNTAGSGCILAHCMGLGKTLQVIALVHTLLTNQSKTKVERVLVVCPVSTVLNWKNEFQKWMPKSDEFEIYELVSCKTTSINHERSYIVKTWHEDGGVLIIGYNMFRTLSNPQNKTLSKKLREAFQKGLVDPGPDLVVCDEGHLLKNEKSNLSIAMNRIKSARRIVLTGTPLQNNLREYWCMVQFIKPNLLGTYKEYLNRFVNPITNGQYTDSTQHDIMVMRRRSHVLHKLLDGVVQRQDYSVLEPYLPPKYEYVIFVKLTETQVKLYKHYMENLARRGENSNKTSALFNDFQELQRICTHPRVLLQKSIKDREKEEKMDESESEGSLKDFIDDETSSSASSSSSSGSEDGCISDDSAEMRSSKPNKKTKHVISRKTRITRALAADNRKNGILSDNEKEEEEQQKEWWEDYISKDELDNINHGSKIFLLFQILKECEDIGDKILVFSQSLFTLNCIEYFLEKIDQATQKGETERVGGHSGSWTLGLDYFRLDGSSSCDDRASWCDQFNDPDNTRARLFLISTRAGGLGINLVAANRVIIFDVSWNPSHDIQSIYRVYRFGQTKPAYIYRFVTYGTMEMKIYERQVTKQAISKRVIDEQQIDRHYSQHDIMELYNTDLDPADRPIPMVPKDVLLGEMLQKHENTIYKYHEHQSLLENKQDEELNEEERKAAWEEFENEKVMRKTTIANFGGLNSAMNFSPQLIQMALANIVRKDNPTWSEIQIKGIIPALASQLQVQMSENDFSMYNRVQQEIRLMQALHAQRMREIQWKQYQAQMQQNLTHDMLGNMNISPEEIRRIQMAQASQNFIQAPTTSTVGAGDVIELND